MHKAQIKSNKRLARYGLTEVAYQSLVQKQNGLCAICFECPSGKGFHVDHDHATNKVRGLLCNTCNRGLGWFKDNTMRLLNAVAYLEKQCAVAA